jgi:hypothetical protein
MSAEEARTLHEITKLGLGCVGINHEDRIVGSSNNDGELEVNLLSQRPRSRVRQLGWDPAAACVLRSLETIGVDVLIATSTGVIGRRSRPASKTSIHVRPVSSGRHEHEGVITT